jgi:hypothetical protein
VKLSEPGFGNRLDGTGDANPFWTSPHLWEPVRGWPDRVHPHNTKRAGVIDTGPCTQMASTQAGAVALPGLTSAPGLLPPEGASPGDGVLFGERGGRPAMMSLI